VTTELGHGLQGHATALDCPLVVLFEQDSADGVGDSGFVEEDADDIGVSPDLGDQSLDRVFGGAQLGAPLLEKGDLSEHVGLGLEGTDFHAALGSGHHCRHRRPGKDAAI
jgi:hypothetical protein